MRRSHSEDEDQEVMGKIKKFTANSWTNCLFNAIKDQSLIVSKDDSITIIKDKYPKSRHHFLVIPSKASCDSVEALTSSDLELIQLMTNRAKRLVHEIDQKVEFKFGFHSFPSLRPLHLHLISQDFDSKYLKTKKHYNSFTTPFFIEAQTVIQNLKDCGKVNTMKREECNRLLKEDIICHICRIKIINIPKLKTHLLTHFPK